MRILSFTVENFKKIRVIEVSPKGRVTTFTGRNGQGKTSVLDGIWALFGGKAAIPEKPVRRGAEKSKLQATLGDDEGRPVLIARRTIAADRTTALTIEAAPGAERPAGTPQAVLDALIGEMSFDPIAFIHMDAKKQVETLRGMVKLEIDLDELTKQSAADYAERTAVNRKVADLRSRAAATIVSPGLPKEKVNEVEILERMRAVDATNAAAAETNRLKSEAKKIADDLNQSLIHAGRQVADCEAVIDRAEEQLAALRKQLEDARSFREQISARAAEAISKWDEMPVAEAVSVTEIAQELQTAQLTNREIEKRALREQLDKDTQEAEREAARLTRAMESREETKREALAKVPMPIDGLTFTEDGVSFRSIPLEQLGEAEQIRVGCALAMASRPKLRCVPIAHGESLDDESLALIEAMAEEHDFQIFMARVETSGKVGIVLEDGLVKAVNE